MIKHVKSVDALAHQQAWDVKNLPAPSAPSNMGDLEVREKFLSDLIDYHCDRASASMAAEGIAPNEFLRAGDLAVITGVINAYAFFQKHRIGDLEKRVAVTEGGNVKFLGTYQRAQEYERGAMVSYRGSAWIAIKDAGISDTPGVSDAWQLAVKNGDMHR